MSPKVRPAIRVSRIELMIFFPLGQRGGHGKFMLDVVGRRFIKVRRVWRIRSHATWKESTEIRMIQLDSGPGTGLWMTGRGGGDSCDARGETLYWSPGCYIFQPRGFITSAPQGRPRLSANRWPRRRVGDPVTRAERSQEKKIGNRTRDHSA